MCKQDKSRCLFFTVISGRSDLVHSEIYISITEKLNLIIFLSSHIKKRQFPIYRSKTSIPLQKKKGKRERETNKKKQLFSRK